MKELKILIISDIHYVEKADHISEIASRKSAYGLKFTKKILEQTKNLNIDLIVLLGDLVDNGEAAGANKDLLALKKEIDKTGKEVIVVPGNHDGDSEKVLDIFDDNEGLHIHKDYQLISFADKYDKQDKTRRNMDKMKDIFGQTDKNKPAVVFQHNPVYPPIASEYPYNITNADEVIEYYSRQKVKLSISGHYHNGKSIINKDGVGYFTCSALCEKPYKYYLLILNGNDYEIEESII